jgi:hypothetical protein
MPAWGFWEWLTYGCIAIAAIMIALDQGVRQSSTAREFLGSIAQSSVWAFTPFLLILLSAAIILWHWLSPPILEKPPEVIAPPVSSHSQPTAAPVSAPNQQTNQDIRQSAYVLNQRLHDLQIKYIRDEENLSGSPDQVALARLELDEKLNRDFRQQFEADLIRLDLDLARRLKIDDSRYASFPPGHIDLGTIGVAGNHLVNLANQLP